MVKINLFSCFNGQWCWNTFVEVPYYFSCWFVKEIDTLSCMAATCCTMFRRRMFWCLAVEKLLIDADWQTTDIDPNGCQDNTRLNGSLWVEGCTWKLYAYVSGWINISQFCWSPAMHSRNKDIRVFLYVSVFPFIRVCSAVVVKFFTVKYILRGVKNSTPKFCLLSDWIISGISCFSAHLLKDTCAVCVNMIFEAC